MTPRRTRATLGPVAAVGRAGGPANGGSPNGGHGGGRPVRVLSVPSEHSYVQHLLDPDPSAEQGFVLLPDPPVPGAAPGVWWPHPGLDADWVLEHAGDLDVVHVHFGTESKTVEELVEWLAALRRARVPLVLTVHDIAHPHLRDQSSYHEQLAVLVPAADALLTLTEGAADVVEERWGVRPEVVRHPHVVPLPLVGAPRPRHEGFRVGLHLKSLRTNLDPVPVIDPLREAVRRVEGGKLHVHAHPELLDEDFGRYDPRVAKALRTLEDDPVAEVHVQPRMSDPQLWDYLRCVDVSVLAYAWATHSGWVEACRDVGTWVLVPEVGHLLEQGGVLAWGRPDEPPSVDRLHDLLEVAKDRRPQAISSQDRFDQRRLLAARHTEVYRRVLQERAGSLRGADVDVAPQEAGTAREDEPRRR
ncbi:glycosyltransferase [Ornithinimicrobium sp. W1679]|uniref:glycosyltransferase n=1 Tax=Ornithinimicrobium sp. W1679 TaxID=3418770 RepID=UPI003CF42D99